MDILPRPDSVTPEQIQYVLDGHSNSNASFLLADRKEYYYNGAEAIRYDPDRRTGILVNFCIHLFNEARNAHSHAHQIDHLLSSLIQCNFGTLELPKSIVRDTRHLLRRLPVYCLYLPVKMPFLDGTYFQEDVYEGEMWDRLQLSNTCSLNVLRTAMYVSTRPTELRGVRDFLMLLGELLTIASQQESDETSRYIACAALWTSWQRVNLLYLYAIVSKEIHLGCRAFVAADIALPEFQVAPDLSIHDVSKVQAFDGQAFYNVMCSWAFELLREEPCCIGVDFRRFHERFSSAWGQQSGRCSNRYTGSLHCGGRYCQRLNGLKDEPQSAHDERCHGKCRRLIWDETSYLRTKAMRAVSVNNTSAKGSIQYCSASNKTLAISHVWIHGQGGRPEDGINECLHKRYAEIATRHGCDSYWWDTACIPQPHSLRKEAIKRINRTFAECKVVLVCDLDIMKIDVSELPISKKELILATALVSDWNVRAWTYLESVKGRNQVYLLCKQNACIKFLDLIKDIWSEGSIEIAVLGLAAHHMLPWNATSRCINRDERMGLEQAGNILSYGPASRKGDDLVIWSLLTNLDYNGTAKLSMDGADQNSEEFCRSFWKAFEDKHITTGFLMSSGPRLTLQGFTWAPRTTLCLPDDDNWLVHSRFDGLHTLSARITSQGLLGEWMMYEFDNKKAWTVAPYLAPLDKRLKEISEEYLENCSKGALIHSVTDGSRNSKGALIQIVAGPRVQAATESFTKYQGLGYQGYQGRHGGSLVAILGMETSYNNQGLVWTWKGIWHWSTSVDFPPFQFMQNILIS